jgi:site-specific DNA recombinase
VDRLSRDVEKFYTISRMLKKQKVAIEYILYDFPPDHNGDLQRAILAAIAQWERAEITMRLVRGRKKNVRHGSVLVHGHAPYGYKSIKPLEEHGLFSLEVDEKEAEVVKVIFQWYGQGMSLGDIVRELDRLQIPTRADTAKIKLGKKRGRCQWSRSTIGDILKNGSYLGNWDYSAEKIPVVIPAIITPEAWETAERRMAANKANSKRNLKYDYLLRRLVECADCGRKMQAAPVTNRGKTFFYYRCYPRENLRNCQNKWMYPAGRVDALVWDWVKSLLSKPEEIRKGAEDYRREQENQAEPTLTELKVIDRQLEEKRTAYNRFLDLYLAGEFNREILNDRKRALELAITGLETRQATLLAQMKIQKTISDEQEAALIEFSEKIAAGFDFAKDDFQTRRELVEALRVTVKLGYVDGQKTLRAKCILGEGYYVLSPLIHKLPYVVAADMGVAARWIEA